MEGNVCVCTKGDVERGTIYKRGDRSTIIRISSFPTGRKHNDEGQITVEEGNGRGDLFRHFVHNSLGGR